MTSFCRLMISNVKYDSIYGVGPSISTGQQNWAEGTSTTNSNSQKRKKFSKEEDDILKRAVLEHGNVDWNLIASLLPDRSPRQCRERYKNYLAPSVLNGPWTKEEEALLEQKFSEIGAKWSRLVQYFPSRTDINIKNHWAALQNRKLKILSASIERNNIIQLIDSSFLKQEIKAKTPEYQTTLQQFRDIDVLDLDRAFDFGDENDQIEF